MTKALILLNFKVYQEALGKRALPLARKIAQAKKNGYEVAIAPSLLTIKEIAEKVSLPVFAQHTSHAPVGASTGRVVAQELKSIGVKGTILNHSERKIPIKYLSEIVKICKENKLKTVICASSLFEIRRVAHLNPDYLAYEPKELIGTNISVTSAKPEIILKVVDLVKSISPKTKVLCGAGVHSKEDLGQALLLGTKGVLIGHAVPKAKDPKKFLEEMLL